MVVKCKIKGEITPKTIKRNKSTTDTKPAQKMLKTHKETEV